MTSHHWSHVMIQCVVLTVHDKPPLIPCYDQASSAYCTWQSTTDPMLRSSVQCLQYMTSHHWSHVMIQCAVLTVNDKPPLIPCNDPASSAYCTWQATTDPMLWYMCSAYCTWQATTDPILWSSEQCLKYMTSHHWSHVMIHVQCLLYMTSHHWSHVMIQCAVLTVHDKPPLIPYYDPASSAYCTWQATTDPTL